MAHFPCDKIAYEGSSSKNPLAFKHYNPEEIVGDKTMREHLRFAAPYAHSSSCGPVSSEKPIEFWGFDVRQGRGEVSLG